MKRTRGHIFMGLLMLAVPAAAAQAQTTIPRYVLGGGGGKLTSGTVTIRSTVGQVIVARKTAGTCLIRSGFWQPAAAISGVDGPEVPVKPELYSNVPNPFNPQTVISFNAGRQEVPARLDIFDIQGRHVRTLVQEIVGPGLVTRTWRGETEQGGQAASGMYFYRLRIAGEVFTKKMMLVK